MGLLLAGCDQCRLPARVAKVFERPWLPCDLFISQSKVAGVFWQQGYRPKALQAHLQVLGSNEGLAQRDPANTQWQVDVAVSCAKLGSLDSLLPISTRKEYLCRGREILLALKCSELLHASQDFTGWFDQAIQQL